MKNDFYRISVDNWNQTLRKSKVFFSTWAAKTIRTLQNGQFQDLIMGHFSTWDQGEIIDLESILVLKLYTDFDKLQNHLKKCFRIDSVYDKLLNEHTINTRKTLISSQMSIPFRVSQMTQSRSQSKSKSQSNLIPNPAVINEQASEMRHELDLKKCINDLEERLSQFFSWRGKLLMYINKFGKILQPTKHDNYDNNMILYHGVNDKMILQPITTKSFFGPLSTSSSYHVAKAFASDKGMVLSISSHYPRLGVCNAFDASVISDYPEEQEWLIGFIYLRINKIYTDSNTIELNIQMPVDSELRFAFFSIHLFANEIFSMNHELEIYLEGYLKTYLFVYKKNIDINTYHNIHKIENKFQKYLQEIIYWATDKNNRFNKFSVPKGNHKGLELDDHIRKGRVHYILAKQFKEFCIEPNLKQIVKIDSVSQGLKKYFFDFDNKNEKYIVSFIKIINLFPNIEEIHFLNWYMFDDIALEKLLLQIENKENALKRIKFLYYDYNDPLENCYFFNHPNNLNDNLIKKLQIKGWKINYKQETNGKNGYSIKIMKKN